jgi:hypothetical protein
MIEPNRSNHHEIRNSVKRETENIRENGQAWRSPETKIVEIAEKLKLDTIAIDPKEVIEALKI